MDVSQNKSGLDTLIDVLGMAHSDGKNNEANYKPKIARTYKPAWKVKGANFYYCISGETGHMILVRDTVIKDENNEIFRKDLIFEKEEQNAWDIEIEEGYLKQNGLPCKKIAEYTDIYIFAAVAFWKELEKNIEILKSNFRNNYPEENTRLELHHINGNPNDNRLDNLIYIPAFIHRRVHIYKKGL